MTNYLKLNMSNIFYFKKNIIEYIESQLLYNGKTKEYLSSIYKRLCINNVDSICLNDNLFENFLCYYFDFKNRFIPKNKYNCNISATIRTKMQNNNAILNTVNTIIKKLENNESLKNGINHYPDSIYRFYHCANNEKYFDYWLNGYGLQHIHFYKGSDEIIILKTNNNDIYLIDVLNHTQFLTNWEIKDVMATIINNFNPELVGFYKAQAPEGMKILGLSQNFSNTDHKMLVQNQINTALEIDGNVYIPIGLTCAGFSSNTVDIVDRVCRGISNIIDDINLKYSNKKFEFYFDDKSVHIKNIDSKAYLGSLKNWFHFDL